jgi:hypothetical protein
MHIRLSKLALVVFLPLALAALAALVAACSGDDTTPTYYLGATDASPPRLGPPDDAGATE